MYPEYGYALDDNKATTLERYSATATAAYYRLPAFKTYGNVHFTPLWYPDGDYAVKLVHSDCWTPAGMISCTVVPEPITISGSAYDDWYVRNN